MIQKKNYAEARNFNVLLFVNDSLVVNYYVFNDFMISDIQKDGNKWILLLSDFYQSNEYWRSEQQIKIVQLDSTLQTVWEYNKNISVPLSGQKIKINQDNYSFTIEVITGCHICYSLAELVLSKEGKFSGLKSIGSANASKLSDEQLHKLFDIH